MPSRRFRALLPVLAWMLACLAPEAPSQVTVRFYGRNGTVREQAGTLVQETLDAVELELRAGNTRQHKTATILEVVYGRGTDAFERGMKALAKGELENAVSQFGLAAQDDQPAWVAPLALLKQAEASAQRGGAGLPQARAALDEFQRRWPEHRNLPEALLLRARYAWAAGDAAAATSDTERIKSLVQAGRTAGDWVVRAQLERGEALLAAQDTRGAGEAFAEAQREAEAAGRAVPPVAPGQEHHLVAVLQTLAIHARAGQGSCLLQQGDLEAARAYYRKLSRDAGDDPALATVAQVGLAECDFREGGAQLKQAQLAFARAALQAAGFPEQHARALYFLGRCAEELGRRGEEPNWRPKMQMYYQDVQERYPDTRWARLAGGLQR